MDTTINNELPNCLNDQELILFKEESDVLQTKFIALSKLGMFDKLAVNKSNNLFIQKISPWRYVVRKIKNQNRETLAIYLNAEIIKYNDFLLKLCNTAKIYNSNKQLQDICVKQFEFIQSATQSIKSLRDKYNMKSGSQSISMALETWYLKLNKIKVMLVEEISNKRLN
jgi:hypothetical protein